MNAVNAIGLIIDVLGAILLFVGTEILNKLMVDLLELMSKDFGTWQMPLLPENHHLKFRNKKRQARWITNIGLMFLMVGFILQLIASL